MQTSSIARVNPSTTNNIPYIVSPFNKISCEIPIQKYIPDIHMPMMGGYVTKPIRTDKRKDDT